MQAVAASLGLAAWAAGGATLRGGVHLAAACAAAFGSLSYLIIFSIAAYNYNQEYSNIGDDIVYTASGTKSIRPSPKMPMDLSHTNIRRSGGTSLLVHSFL